MNDKKIYYDKIRNVLSIDEFHNYKRNKTDLIELGYEYVEIGDYKRALKLFCIDVRLNGYDPDSLNGLGISLCELGKLKTSKTFLEKAIALYPDDAITLANLAGVYWEMGDIDLSIYYYKKSLELDPLIFETHYNLINLYHECGYLYMAYISCLDMLNIFPGDTEGIELRNEILLNLGISIF